MKDSFWRILVKFFKFVFKMSNKLVRCEWKAYRATTKAIGIPLEDSERFTPTQLNEILYGSGKKTREELYEQLLSAKKPALYTKILLEILVRNFPEQLAP